MTLFMDKTPPPSEKVFQNHQFILYKNVYYDPSYGVTYFDTTSFQQKAIEAFVTNISGPDSQGLYTMKVVKKTPGITSIVFS